MIISYIYIYNICCTYPSSHNNVLTCYDNTLNIRTPNTYPHTPFPLLQTSNHVYNPATIHFIITNISALYYYYYILLLGYTNVNSGMENVYPLTYNNTYIYIILLLYTPSPSPPHLFIRNQHPPLPHSTHIHSHCILYFPMSRCLTRMNLCLASSLSDDTS